MKISDLNENGKESKPESSQAASNGSSVATAQEFQSLDDVQRSSSSAPADSKLRSSSRSRGTTGPRTSIGKRRSKYNATKYAIFSTVALLPWESRAKFNLLLKGLQDHYHPVGAMENFKVDEYATNMWRYRRFLIAETAEFQKGIASADRNGDHQPSMEAILGRLFGDDGDGNLIRKIAERGVRKKCLGLLRELKTGLETGGFDKTRDSAILTKLYGNYKEEMEPTLYGGYRIWLSKADCSGQEREKDSSTSPEQCKKSFLEEVEAEIRRLELYRSVESERIGLEGLRHYVPDSSQLDRLLRHGASVERSIDRTERQLERLQRMRLGHPMPPSLNVDIDI
jgi:hypothetical protein